MKMLRRTKPISHGLPSGLLRFRKSLWSLFGYDDLYYLHMAKGEPARIFAELAPPPRTGRPTPIAANAEIVVCVHIHYPDVWEEMAAFLAEAMERSQRDWAMVVTLTPDAASLAGQIRQEFPGARLFEFENRGRDIGPFFELLRRGEFSGAKAVCKLHGKRSMTGGRSTDVGELWRRSVVRLLLEQAAEAIRALENGFTAVGPEHVVMPSERVSELSAWAGTRDQLVEWAHRMDVQDPDIQFFAGSMLWLSQPALEQLAKLGLQLTDFALEPGSDDLTLAYAGERIFLIAARAAGGKIGTLSVDRDGDPPQPI